MTLTVPLARKIVQQLKAGTTPLEGVRFLNVGRGRYYQEVERLLGDIQTGGGADVHFLKADYGIGKTHFIGMIQSLALNRNWVTSYVKLSKADGVRLDKFEQLYAAILRNCVCQGLLVEHQQTYDPGEKNGWPWILDEWIQRHVRSESGGGIDPNSLGARDRTINALDVLLRSANVSGDFRAAVRLYAKSSFDRANTQDVQQKESVVRWFGCSKVPELKPHGVLGPIIATNARDILRSILSLLHRFGYGGMAIFIDEAENVLDYSKLQRRVAYQNLRELLDNVDGRATGDSLGHAVCYVAATPAMFVGEKGFREYEALQSRIEEIHLPIQDLQGRIDYRAVVIDLALSPLTVADRRTLALKIRDIHAAAYEWNPSSVVTDDNLNAIVDEFEKRAGEQGGLRPLCRAIAKTLDLAQQHGAH